MGKITQQSEESKYIKRINEQLNEVTKLVPADTDNPIISVWSRAIRESGLEYTKDEGTGRYRIRNTAKNQAIVSELQRTIGKYNPPTAGQYRKQVKQELKREAERKTEGMTKQDAKQYIKDHTSKAAVNKRIQIKATDTKISSMLDLIYNQTGSTELGARLSAMTKGKPITERDSEQIYDLFDEIQAEFRRVQMGLLTDEEEQRLIDRQQMLDDYAFPAEDDDE